MSTEEPAWRAGLYEAVEERFPLIRNAVTRGAIGAFVAEHIKAAEERGRREALRIVSDWCVEANENGGVDAGDLAFRLEQAGFPLPDDPDRP